MTVGAQGEYFEQILDRRLGDFEKIVDTRLQSIQDGVTRMQETMTVFVQQVSNLHINYVPRPEVEREHTRLEQEILTIKNENKELSKKVEKLEGWRNYLAGAIGILAFTLAALAQSQFWK